MRPSFPAMQPNDANPAVPPNSANKVSSRFLPGKLLGLQYLRAIASVGVVIFHAASKNGFDFEIGQAGVDVFFVLSGFLMWTVTANGTSPYRFLMDRIRRIVPIYWFVTTVLLIGAVVGLFPAIRLTATHIITSYGFIASQSPSNGHVWPLLVPGWTLNYEMFFYAIFAAILFAPRRNQLHLLALSLAGAVAAGLVLKPSNGIAAFYANAILLEFLAGVLLAASLKPGMRWPSHSGPLLIILALAGFAIAWRLAWLEPRPLVYGVPAFLALCGVLALERGGTLPRSRMLLMLGDASYSIYLSHALTISLVAKLAQRAGIPPYLSMVGATMLGIVVGLFMYRWIERPLIGWLKPGTRDAAKHAEPVAQ